MIKLIQENGTVHTLKGVRVVSEVITAYEATDMHKESMKRLYGPSIIQPDGLAKVTK